MATVTAGYNWVSGETVTPAKLNSAAAPTVVVADGEVTVAKLAAAVQQLLVPAGAVQAFAMNSAPTGWLAADGTAVSRSTYAALFSAIGTTYGAGDGSTTFALPDLRGYFVRGSGTNSDGVAAGTFGAKQADALESHSHKIMNSGTSTAPIDSTNKHVAMVGNQGANSFSYHLYGTASAPNTADSGSAGDTETRPANIAMLYCIKH
jgi:microcystin-dependent protein